MFPELFHIGPLTIYTYGALFALAVSLAAFLATKRASTIQLDTWAAFDLVVWTGLAGIAGGRLVYIIQHFSYFISHPEESFKLWQGGLVFHGGVLGSLIYVYVFSRRKKKDFFSVLDFLIPYVALAYGVGRIGCFFNGCCYGRPFQGPWAVRYPFLDESVHPTQIYSSLIGFALFAFLLKLNQRKVFEGQTSTAYFFIYSAARIAVEFYRGDKPHDILGFATDAQVVFFFILILSLVFYCYRRLKFR